MVIGIKEKILMLVLTFTNNQADFVISGSILIQ